MRIVNWFIIIIFTTLFLYYSTDDVIKKEPKEILNNMTIHEALFNITRNTVSYTNLYEEDITMKRVMFNIAHPIIYGIVVEINTIIPLAMYIASGSYANLLMKIILLYLLVLTIFLIPNFLKAFIALYFFIKEKKRTKEKWWH